MRIVTADDSRVTKGVLHAIITNLGHEHVAHAFNGIEAVRVCRETQPDVVILDVIMPPMNGDEAAEIIHYEHLAEHIVMVTSQGQKVILDLVKRFGAKRLVKPYREDQLAKILGALAV